MHVPTAAEVAGAFGLGEPTGELVLVRRGDTDTWRLETDGGSYFVKGYWTETGGQFVAGGLTDQLRLAMAFEARALAAGMDMAEPIAPLEPVLGWATRIDDRLVRVNRWIESRGLEPDDDIAEWLGRTMAHVHRLQPVRATGLPDWWRTALRPRTDWEEWFAEARRRGKSWSGLAQGCLPQIIEATAGIEELCHDAPDCVTTHGDFKTHNLLITPRGPVLIDWDTVRVDSAALEAGRVAYIFGAGELEPMRRILTAYVEAGGELTWIGSDLFASVVRNQLQLLFEHVLVSLGHRPAARWMADPEQALTELLTALPGKLGLLSQSANNLP
ncbi:aminoglycoside phosphotransferase family protein [Kribbella sp. NBC_00359]|uniref:aminoglycoside phosphotransferase family protein n=1 Tax=Kribbella sp. NBC_00359 TaxID=2975966 RepID=UPI002E1B5592